MSEIMMWFEMQCFNCLIIQQHCDLASLPHPHLQPGAPPPATSCSSKLLTHAVCFLITFG